MFTFCNLNNTSRKGVTLKIKNSTNKIESSGHRPGTATQKRGAQRVDEILDAATVVLVQSGYGDFTMRRIADQAGMKLGNLQYYFPTKSDLLQALLEGEFDRYTLERQKLVGESNATPKSLLNKLLDYILRDQENARCCSIFWELWALSTHDTGAAKVMDKFYQAYCAEIATLFREVNPNLGKRAAERRAALAVSMLEGLSLLRGHGKTRHSNINGIENELRETLLALAMR